MDCSKTTHDLSRPQQLQQKGQNTLPTNLNMLTGHQDKDHQERENKTGNTQEPITKSAQFPKVIKKTLNNHSLLKFECAACALCSFVPYAVIWVN